MVSILSNDSSAVFFSKDKQAQNCQVFAVFYLATTSLPVSAIFCLVLFSTDLASRFGVVARPGDQFIYHLRLKRHPAG